MTEERTCVECGHGAAVIEDFRDSPIGLGKCLCADCGEGSLVAVIEEHRHAIDDLVGVLRQLNPESIYLDQEPPS